MTYCSTGTVYTLQ